jgi:hypothetical protein
VTLTVELVNHWSQSCLINYVDQLEQDEFPGDIEARSNKDKTLDLNGRRLLDLCRNSGLIIANGRLGSDAGIGEFTYCSHMGRSVVDYLLLAQGDFKYVSHFEVLPFNEFSDHAPLSFSLHSTGTANHMSGNNSSQGEQSKQLLWDDSKAQTLRDQLQTSSEYVNGLTSQLEGGIDTDSVSKAFSDYMYDKAFAVFGKLTTHKRKSSQATHTVADWFDDSCRQSKGEFKVVCTS